MTSRGQGSCDLGPWVVKPVDGVGGSGIRVLAPSDSVLDEFADSHRVERFHAGQPASVSFLFGPSGHYQVLAACLQDIRECRIGGAVHYVGGEVLSRQDPLSQRAVQLAECCIQQLLGSAWKPLGYIGLDLILGPDATGNDDVILEINPRLTTSYVGLQRATSNNLADAMLQIASGVNFSLPNDWSPISFSALDQVSSKELERQ